MNYKTILYIVISIFSIQVNAQDPVFTQFFLIPEALNPGFTGTLVTGYTGLIHRSQWPDKTKKIESDFAFINSPITEDGSSALGLTILNQREVFTRYNYLQVNAAYSYNVDLNSDWRFRLGIEGGYGNKNYNFSNLILGDQINRDDGSISGGSIDPGLIYLRDKVHFFDISSGVIFYNDDLWIGTSLKHLNRPNIAFSNDENLPLNMFLSVHGGYSFELDNSALSFLPDNSKMLLTANYMRQGQYNRLDIGGALDVNPLIIGVLAATNPERRSDNSHLLTSLNFFASIQLDRFVLGYSYDVNTSNFGNSQGIHELSLTWQLGRGCPTCNNYLVKRPWGRNY